MNAPFDTFVKNILSSGGVMQKAEGAIMDSRSKGVQYVQIGSKRYKLEKVTI